MGMKAVQTKPTNQQHHRKPKPTPTEEHLSGNKCKKGMVFLSKECSLIEKMISYNWEISAGKNIASMCVCYMLECALTTGFCAPLTNMCPLIAAFQASYALTTLGGTTFFPTQICPWREVASGLFLSVLSHQGPCTITMLSFSGAAYHYSRYC